jgi:hypothetical protein
LSFRPDISAALLSLRRRSWLSCRISYGRPKRKLRRNDKIPEIRSMTKIQWNNVVYNGHVTVVIASAVTFFAH